MQQFYILSIHGSSFQAFHQQQKEAVVQFCEERYNYLCPINKTYLKAKIFQNRVE